MITINHHVANPLTPKGEGSAKIEQLFRAYFAQKPDITGRIDIFSNVSVSSQMEYLMEIDLFIICEFNGFILSDFYEYNGSCYDLEIKNLAFTLEMKHHDFSRIERRGPDLYVRYGSRVENATEQSRKAKCILTNSINKRLKRSPFVFDYLWCSSLDKNAVNTIDNGDGLNLLPSSFDVEDLISQTYNQRLPIGDSDTDRRVVSSWRDDLYDSIVDLFSR